MTNKKTQREKVVEILLRDKQISNFFSINTRLSIRLSDIIHKLRKDGWEIETKMEGKECIYKLVSAPTQTLF
jgi:hypothetical protein